MPRKEKQREKKKNKYGNFLLLDLVIAGFFFSKYICISFVEKVDPTPIVVLNFKIFYEFKGHEWQFPFGVRAINLNSPPSSRSSRTWQALFDKDYPSFLKENKNK